MYHKFFSKNQYIVEVPPKGICPGLGHLGTTHLMQRVTEVAHAVR